MFIAFMNLDMFFLIFAISLPCYPLKPRGGILLCWLYQDSFTCPTCTTYHLASLSLHFEKKRVERMVQVVQVAWPWYNQQSKNTPPQFLEDSMARKLRKARKIRLGFAIEGVTLLSGRGFLAGVVELK